MAINQIDFVLFPKQDNTTIPLSKSFDNEFDMELFDDSPFWEAAQIKRAAFEPISDFLPKIKAWSPILDWYGEEMGHRVDIWSEDDIVTSASFRIDFMSPDETLLLKLIAFCKEKGFTVVSLASGVQEIELDPEAFFKFIGESTQMKTFHWLVSGK